MKIIKPGITAGNKYTCPYCSCEYEYDATDVQTGYELTSTYGYVICPTCGKKNIVNNFNYTWPNPWSPYTYCDCRHNEPLTQLYNDPFKHIPRIECSEVNNNENGIK